MQDLSSKSILWEKCIDGDSFLVFGADGFIGRNIVNSLCKVLAIRKMRNSRVTAVVHNLPKAREILGEQKYLDFIEQDITFPFDIDKPADFIFNASGVNDTKICLKDPEKVMQVNVCGVRNILDYVKGQREVKGIVLISSASVYGDIDVASLQESHIGCIDFTNIKNVYAISKLNMEFLAAIYISCYGLPIKIVRPFHMFGPSMTSNNLMAEFLQCVKEGKDIVLYSTGREKRNFTYISDVVEAIFYVLYEGKSGECYNIGNKASTISIVGLAEKINMIAAEKAVNVKVKPADVLIPSNLIDMIPSTGKIEKLGWEPKISLEKGISLLL